MEELIKENTLLKITNEQLEAKIKILEKHVDILVSKNPPKENIKQGSNHGDGPIRSKEGNKCYHGCTTDEASWAKNPSKYNHVFWVYNNDFQWKTYHHPDKWDIRRSDLTSFCSNCELDYELSKRKRTHKIYRCLGHEIEG
jgi:hypothetical protein|tara:strand:- start:152 stop:574 length:423 start_codon:yes stop_codon:yes gene_type:complete